MAILQISVVFRGTWGIYGANILHQPVSKIMKNLRDVLVVPEAARGLSISGLDSFELLVEESTEE